jgi:hypothetical protein
LGKPSNEQISAQEQKSASFLISNLAATPSQNRKFFVGFCKAYMFNEEHCAIEAARVSVFFFLFSLSPECKILPPKHQQQQVVCHTVGLAIYIKKVSEDKKKNYGNSNIWPCKNLIFKKIL